MGTPVVPFSTIRHAAEVYQAAVDEGWPTGFSGRGPRSALAETATAFDTRHKNVRRWLEIASALGIKVPGCPAMGQAEAAQLRRRYKSDLDYLGFCAGKPTSRARAKPAPVAPEPPKPDTSQVVSALRRPGTLDDVAGRLGLTPGGALDVLRAAREAGAAVLEQGGKWSIDTAPALGSSRDEMPELVSAADGTITFGAIGDSHLGSKYARLDCLEDWYTEAERRGIRTVLHAGNWLDGEAEFNKHDLLAHGLDSQMRYLAKHHPQRDGMQTWAITGADHEGWWARREGVDVGRYAERVMRDAGRTDWRDVGYMECFIRLRHAASGKSSMLCLMHPGGGSAYAISYAPQKIIEGFDGGDKPAVLLIGHYHKASYQLTRNVHAIQVGCFQDQTVFMRQKKLSAHLGGFFVTLHLDPRTGAVNECTSTFRNYFVRDYYNGRWSQHGDVTLAGRVAR